MTLWTILKLLNHPSFVTSGNDAFPRAIYKGSKLNCHGAALLFRSLFASCFTVTRSSIQQGSGHQMLNDPTPCTHPEGTKHWFTTGLALVSVRSDRSVYDTLGWCLVGPYTILMSLCTRMSLCTPPPPHSPGAVCYQHQPDARPGWGGKSPRC